MSRRRGNAIFVALACSLVVAIASLSWSVSSAAARPQRYRGEARSQARVHARSAWLELEAQLARGEQPVVGLSREAREAGAEVQVWIVRASAERLEVRIRAEVAAGADRLGHELRVRAKTNARGRWWIVDWEELAG